MLFTAVLATLVSIAILIFASSVMLKNAIEISKLLRISPLITGSTIVAIGTGLPTIAVSVMIILTNPSSIDVAIGNVVGTTVVNLGLALGIPAFLTTIVTKYSVYEKELPLYLAVMGIVTTFALDEKLSRWEGALIFGVYLLVSFVIYQYAKRERSQTQAYDDITNLSLDSEESKTGTVTLIGYLWRLIVGFIFLMVASLGLSYFSGPLAEGLGIDPYVLGLTVIGIGTSLPTIVSCIQAARSGFLDIVLGNVFGGNIVNLGLGLGVPALLTTITLDTEAIEDINFTNLYNMVIILLILVEMRLLGTNKTLSRISGIIIVGTYLVYLGGKVL